MRRNKLGNWWVKIFASFFYLGYSPIAPGTVGAAGGLGFYLLIRFFIPGFIPESPGELLLGVYPVSPRILSGGGLSIISRREGVASEGSREDCYR